jgi:hypothetical protein
MAQYRYRVYWKVNDGRCGYPDMEAEPEWSEHPHPPISGYLSALQGHAAIRGVKVHPLAPRLVRELIGQGRVNGLPYRDYLVVYQGLDEAGTMIEEEVRVLCLGLYEN